MTYSPGVDGNAKLYVAIAAGALPALIAIFVFDYLDRKRPEPWWLRWLVVLVGVLTVFPVLFVDGLILGAAKDHIEPGYTYNGALFKSFIVAAAVEEMFKILVIYWIVWRRSEFDERMDGIVYGARAGLGFALFENVVFLYNTSTTEQLVQTGILRALLAVPGHAMWTAIIGYAAVRARFDNKGFGFFGGYLLAVAAHGAYDYAIFAQPAMHLEGKTDLALVVLAAPLVIIIACLVIVRRMAKIALRLDDADAARRAASAPPPAMPPSDPAPVV
jgi:protease PrsW